MRKNIAIIGVFIVSFGVILNTIIFSANNNNVVNANNGDIWYHYSAVDPSENKHGSKEFWANSNNNCQTFVLEEPIGGIIEDRTFSSNPYFNELTFDDERYIPSYFEERNALYPIAIGEGYYKYGIYPDVVINDQEMINSLNSLEESAIDENNGWYLYNGSYYTYITTNPQTSGAIYHNGDKIPENAKNWFKCNPITWIQLVDDNGDKFLLAYNLLDVFQYDDSSSDYMMSNIRHWLNGDFYNKAFALGSKYLKPTLTNDNIDKESAPSSNFDKVFLPTYQNYTNQYFGFNQDPNQSDFKRQGRTTDFTRASGAQLSSNPYYGRYFTRTPSILTPETKVFQINYEGQIYGYTVDDNNAGVRPAITINFDIN